MGLVGVVEVEGVDARRVGLSDEARSGWVSRRTGSVRRMRGRGLGGFEVSHGMEGRGVSRRTGAALGRQVICGGWMREGKSAWREVTGTEGSPGAGRRMRRGGLSGQCRAGLSLGRVSRTGQSGRNRCGPSGRMGRSGQGLSNGAWACWSGLSVRSGWRRAVGQVAGRRIRARVVGFGEYGSVRRRVVVEFCGGSECRPGTGGSVELERLGPGGGVGCGRDGGCGFGQPRRAGLEPAAARLVGPESSGIGLGSRVRLGPGWLGSSGGLELGRLGQVSRADWADQSRAGKSGRLGKVRVEGKVGA